ncbi:MAG: hypothetical protein V4607_08685 [Pseudomonadota bacterium]
MSKKYQKTRPRVLGAPEAIGALADVLATQLSHEELRAVFYSVGTKLAESFALEQVETVGDFEAKASQALLQRDWGWIKVEERLESLDIWLNDAPLQAWFGEASLIWSAAIFEGLFASWLQSLGAGEGLELRQVVTEVDPGEAILFRLSRQLKSS